MLRPDRKPLECLAGVKQDHGKHGKYVLALQSTATERIFRIEDEIQFDDSNPFRTIAKPTSTRAQEKEQPASTSADQPRNMVSTSTECAASEIRFLRALIPKSRYVAAPSSGCVSLLAEIERGTNA